MKNHEIKEEELAQFEFDHLFAAHSKAGVGTKRLMICKRPGNCNLYYKIYYKVRGDEGESGTESIELAVDRYNRIRL